MVCFVLFWTFCGFLEEILDKRRTKERDIIILFFFIIKHTENTVLCTFIEARSNLSFGGRPLYFRARAGESVVLGAFWRRR